MKNIFIVGLGLIGASLAECIAKEHPSYHRIGWDNHQRTRQIALENQIVTKISSDFETGAQGADIIIFATPVGATKKYLQELATLSLKTEVLVSDTGSTKKELAELAADLPFTFIGGHPMAGSHKSGVTAVDGDLFENAYYIFTPIKKDTRTISGLASLQELLKGTRAKYVELSPTEHDTICGMLSHLPHIIAASLVTQADLFNHEHPRAKQLAAGGFRDITRIASSDPAMWTDILLSNREILMSQLTIWQEQMSKIQRLLIHRDQEGIFQFFDHAKDTRNQLPIHKNGAIPAFFDLFIDVPDVPGVIAEVTGLLGIAGISLINLKIQETREDVLGVLQISFKNQQDLQRAIACLTAQTNYPCRVK